MHRVTIKPLSALLLFTLPWLSSPPAHAQAPGTLEREEAEILPSPFHSTTRVGAGLGLFSHENLDGDPDARVTFDVNVTWNLLAIGYAAAPGDPATPPYLGFRTGIGFARIDGQPDPTDLDPDESAGLAYVPLALELGGHPTGNGVYLGVTGGAHLYLIDEDASLKTGRRDADTEFFPALGGNIGWAATRDIGVMLRGEYTFTPADDLLNATLRMEFGFG